MIPWYQKASDHLKTKISSDLDYVTEVQWGNGFAFVAIPGTASSFVLFQNEQAAKRTIGRWESDGTPFMSSKTFKLRGGAVAYAL